MKSLVEGKSLMFSMVCGHPAIPKRELPGFALRPLEPGSERKPLARKPGFNQKGKQVLEIEA